VVGESQEKKVASFSMGLKDDGSGWTMIPNQKTYETTPNSESPPRKRDVDLSPPRKRDIDLSPPRKRDIDLSPPRKRDMDLSPPRKREEPKSGLLTGHEVAKETERKRKEQEERFAKADPKYLGKGADTIYRDKKGKKLSINEMIRSEEGRQQEEEYEWGTGVAQKKIKEERKAYEEQQKDKPFARLPDDADLDSMYKDILRWGDPMAHLGKKNEKGKTTVEQRWKGAAPLNRFNILPGKLWDGVDRSNGFEKKYLSKEGNKVAKTEQAYLWSVEDM